MEASNITHILACLNKNLVTIPINTNGFMELDRSVYCLPEREKIFDRLDDILTECKKMPKKSASQTIIRVSPLVSLLFALRHMELPNKSKNGYSREVIENEAQELCRFLATTLNETHAKTLDLSRHKLTKKGLQLLLDTCLVTDNVEIDPIITLFCKIKNINVLIQSQENSELQSFYINQPENQHNILIIKKREEPLSYEYVASTTYTDYIQSVQETKKREYRAQNGFAENLKNLSVKDLRTIANNIGIDASHAKKELIPLIRSAIQ